MEHLSSKQKVAVMIAIMSGMLFSALNQTIIGTAMPRIIAKLGGMEYYSWVFTIYMLTASIMIILVGKLSDIYGRKVFLLSGLSIFIISSLLAGTSETIFQLIAYRGLQGLGGGMIMSASLTAVGDLFSPRERGRWQGVLGAVFGLASIAGPTAGGYIVDNLDWHWVFWVNLPIGVIALALISRLFPMVKGTREPVDYLGAVFLTALMTPLLLAFSWAGGEYAWTSGIILGLFAVSAVALILFVITEWKVASPIIPLHLFKDRTFTISNVAGFLTGVGMFGSIMFIPLFIQGVSGLSALQSGYLMIPMTLAHVSASAVSGQITSRTGKYKTQALFGLAVMAAGMYLLSRMDMQTTTISLIINMIITGIGLGITMPIFVVALQNALPHRYLGVTTSSIQLFRSLGGVVGVAVMGTIMSNNLTTELGRRLPAEVQQLSGSPLAGLTNPQALLDPSTIENIRTSLPPGATGLFEELLQVLKQSLSISLEHVFLFGAVVLAGAFLLSLMLREIPLRGGKETEKASAVFQPGEETAVSAK